MRLLLAFVICLVPFTVNAQSPSRTVFVVRHAEKADNSRDPQLSERGQERAQALAAALEHTGVDAVFVTQFVRTGATAAPSAMAAGVQPVVLAATGPVPGHAAEIADAVRARLAGEVILVVGHSNTVPAIVAALGGPEMQDICDAEYSNLFVLVVPNEGPTSTAHVRFGQPDEGICPPESPAPRMPPAR